MADAWTVVETREPEWDAWARAEAIALILHRRRVCSGCGDVDTMVPVTAEDRDWTWGDGQKFRVQVWRCLACAATATVNRDMGRRFVNVKPKPGMYGPQDGLRTSVEQIAGVDEEVVAATRAAREAARHDQP